MKIGIDVLMTVLLTVFIVSFVVLMIFGQVWEINLSMADRSIETFDRDRAQSAFIASCFAIGSGASMLFIIEKRFPQSEEADATSTDKPEGMANQDARS
jgi:hypothetical protein